jgi:hypothetical protein
VAFLRAVFVLDDFGLHGGLGVGNEHDAGDRRHEHLTHKINSFLKNITGAKRVNVFRDYSSQIAFASQGSPVEGDDFG